MFSSIESLCPPITGETEEGIANYMNKNIGNFCILIKHFQCKNKFEHLPNILRDVLLELLSPPMNGRCKTQKPLSDYSERGLLDNKKKLAATYSPAGVQYHRRGWA